jgi:hypothetical protein
MNSSRFTVDGGPDLERRLAQLCLDVRNAVLELIPPWKLDGILLGGGYGRGEGGVLQTPEGERPYNDLEFYVFLRGNTLMVERKFRGPLHQIGARLSPAAGLEVEFKVMTLTKLLKAPPSMFYYDLALGNRLIFGDAAVLDSSLAAHRRDAHRIPLHEATRLLMNRCSGLLFSLERLKRPEFGPEEADFVGRNLAKLELALGDVVLTSRGEYHWSCRERHQRLLAIAPAPEMPFLEQVQHHHRAGVDFKLHPQRTIASREELEARHRPLSDIARQVWVWLENRRLGTSFSNSSEYARSSLNKCPEQPALRNRLVNLRDRCWTGMISGRYPRERLFHALCLLMWDDDVLAGGPRAGQIRRELQTREVQLPGLVAAYERLWHRYH